MSCLLHLRGRICVKLFFEIFIVILPEGYNRENTVSHVAKKSATDWQQNPFHVLYHVALGCFGLCEYTADVRKIDGCRVCI